MRDFLTFGYEMIEHNGIEIRECETLAEFSACVAIQREAFGVDDLELLPLRYFVAVKSAGGWILGAFENDELIGFVLSMNAFIDQRRAFYSHLAGVRQDYEGKGVGAALKWAQRERALREGVTFIKWALDPAKARNAYFSIEKLGGIVRSYRRNYQGVSYLPRHDSDQMIALESDRVFVEWQLDSDRVKVLASGEIADATDDVKQVITIPKDWVDITKTNPADALLLRERIRTEFEIAQSQNLVCRGFRLLDEAGEYCFYRNTQSADRLDLGDGMEVSTIAQ